MDRGWMLLAETDGAKVSGRGIDRRATAGLALVAMHGGLA